MAAQWSRLISDDLWQVLSDAGVEDAADLAFFFVSEDEAREWAVLQQCSAGADNFVAAWSIVRRLVSEDRSDVDRILAVELARRRATPKQRPARASASSEEPVVKRRRAAVTSSITGLEGVRVVDYHPKSAWSFDPPSSLERDALWELWLQSGPDNLRFQECLRSGSFIQAPSEAPRIWVLSKFEKFSDEQLKPPLRAWARWEDWRSRNCPGVAACHPDAISFFHFIEHVACGGPTAARSVWHHLHFLRQRLGLDLPLDDTREYVMGKARTKPVVQARVVEPAFVVGLLYALSTSAGPGRVLLQCVTLALFSCIRWRHLQRSYFTHSDGTLLHAHCVQGKRRVQGVRPPYSWTVPLLDGLCAGLPGLPASPDWAQGLSELFADLAPRVPAGIQPFLVPRIRRDSSGCWALGDVLCQPMGYRAFTEAFRGVLVQLGEGPDSESYTFNSLRRFMATLANFLHLDPQQAQAIGHWQEIPHGSSAGGGGSLDSMRARCPMAERYSGVKHQVAGRVQLACVAIFFDMVRQALPSPLPPNWNSQVLTWGMLERFRPSSEAVSALLRRLGSVAEPGTKDHPWFSAEIYAQLLDPLEEAGRAPVFRARGRGARHHHTSGRSAPASSSAALSPVVPAEVPLTGGDQLSSSDASVSSEEGIPEGQSAFPNHLLVAELQWFVTKRSKICHIVQEEADGLLIPWCRSSAFSGSPIERGTNPCAQTLVVCLGCMRRMPAGTREAIKLGLDDKPPTSPSPPSELE